MSAIVRRSSGFSEAVHERFGKVDILINCAGRIQRAPTLDFAEESWTAILDTNLTGTLRACQIFGARMLERGYGRIVNIASLNTFVSLREVAAYAASKAAVGALTRSLAVEWSARGVNVNAIAPGVFRTALNSELLEGTERGRELKMRTPMGRFGAVEETGGIGDLSEQRGGVLHHGGDPGGRWGISGEWRESVTPVCRSGQVNSDSRGAGPNRPQQRLAQRKRAQDHRICGVRVQGSPDGRVITLLERSRSEQEAGTAAGKLVEVLDIGWVGPCRAIRDPWSVPRDGGSHAGAVLELIVPRPSRSGSRADRRRRRACPG